MNIIDRRKGAIKVMAIIINFVFIPLLLLSGSGIVKRLKMDGVTYAKDVTFEEIYNEGYYEDGSYVAPYTSYKPTYFYEVKGDLYTYTPYRVSESKAELANLNKIYYDESNPSDCVAENETQLEPFIIIFFIYLIFMAIVTTMHLKVKSYSGE